MDPEETSQAPAPTETQPEPKDLSAGLLDAINAGVEGQALPTAADAETPADDAAESAGEAAEEGEEADAAEAAAKAAKPAAAKPDDKAGDKAAKAKEADPVNDPIPAEITGRTRERMEALVAKVKEATTERNTIKQQRDDLVGMVAETRATPEQFNQSLQYLAAVNSGDPKQIRGAVEILRQELTALCNMIGEPVPGVDALSNHADLRQAVEAGDISQAHAQELATARDARAFTTRRQQQTTETQRQETEQAQAQESGRQALDALEERLKSDPDYARKRPILLATLVPIFEDLHPSKWAQKFEQSYRQLKLGPAPVKPAAATPGQQPLRARQPAGPAAKAPASILDAIEAGVERAGRR
jgi:hypothetical protein